MHFISKYISHSIGSSVLTANKTTLASLPSDVLKNIFTCLSKEDLQSTFQVTRQWRDLSLSTPCFSIRLFVNFLFENLPSLPLEHKAILLALLEDPTRFSQPTLKRLKEPLLWAREHILTVLKPLDASQLDRLKQASKGLAMPPFFESIFELTQVYQKLAQTHLMEDGHPQAIAFRECVQILAKLGELNKAVYTTNFIRRVCERTIAFNSIRAKRYELALKCASLTQRRHA